MMKVFTVENSFTILFVSDVEWCREILMTCDFNVTCERQKAYAENLIFQNVGVYESQRFEGDKSQNSY